MIVTKKQVLEVYQGFKPPKMTTHCEECYRAVRAKKLLDAFYGQEEKGWPNPIKRVRAKLTDWAPSGSLNPRLYQYQCAGGHFTYVVGPERHGETH